MGIASAKRGGLYRRASCGTFNLYFDELRIVNAVAFMSKNISARERIGVQSVSRQLEFLRRIGRGCLLMDESSCGASSAFAERVSENQLYRPLNCYGAPCIADLREILLTSGIVFATNPKIH